MIKAETYKKNSSALDDSILACKWPQASVNKVKKLPFCKGPISYSITSCLRPERVCCVKQSRQIGQLISSDYRLLHCFAPNSTQLRLLWL